MLLQRQVLRAQRKSTELGQRLHAFTPPAARNANEWFALQGDALRKAAERERNGLRSFLKPHPWRLMDLAAVLDELGLLEQLFDTAQGWRIYMARVRKLHTKLEQEDFGIRFGLFIHFELKLTLPKIQLLAEAACKKYQRKIDRYRKSDWLNNPHYKRDFLSTPRIVPTSYKLKPIIAAIGKALGVIPGVDGLLAFRSIEVVVQELMARNAGTLKMPTLPEFYGGLRLPIIISRDATGKGNLQFTTAGARCPWMSKSAQKLELIAFGNCGDDRDGTGRVLGLRTSNRSICGLTMQQPASTLQSRWRGRSRMFSSTRTSLTMSRRSGMGNTSLIQGGAAVTATEVSLLTPPHPIQTHPIPTYKV